jgi:hypothetical protein
MRDFSVLAGVELFPAAINDLGQVVGSTFTPAGDRDRNLLWDPVSGVVDLGAFQPLALNNNGQVMGVSYGGAHGLTHPAIWDRVNGVRLLGTGWPEAINDAGEVAGWDEGGGFVWDEVNGRRNFSAANFTHDTVASIVGITASGYVVGTLMQPELDTVHLFIYKTTVTDLHPVATSLTSTAASAVNDAHVILGSSRDNLRSSATIFRPQDGALPEVPIMPVAVGVGEWIFYDARSGGWFDPPTAPGFDYEMLSGSVFTSILDFPTGFNAPFTVVADGCEIPASFVPGDSVDFVALCGRGVPAFGVRGIDPASELAVPHFPLRLAFDTPLADFRMKAFIEGGTVDATPPILTATRTAANEHGWNDSAVVVTFSCVDAGSPIDIAPVSPVRVATEGAGQSVSASCKDAAGNEATLTVDGINIDFTPPVLEVPGAIVVAATTANGAAVTYSASATDNFSAPTPACSESSGSVFPVGTTTVSCTASDLAGNSASAAFTITVRGVAEQLVDLIERLRRTPLQPAVEARLIATLQEALDDPRRSTTLCRVLRAFSVLVQLQSGRAIPPALAAELAADAHRIRMVIGCSA